MTWRRTIPALSLAAGLALVGLPGSAARADAGWHGDERGRDHHPSPITIETRQKYFGAENVDARDGRIRDDKVIFSWITNASVAVSVLGHLVFLDTYINRLELPPAPATPTPTTRAGTAAGTIRAASRSSATATAMVTDAGAARARSPSPE